MEKFLAVFLSVLGIIAVAFLMAFSSKAHPNAGFSVGWVNEASSYPADPSKVSNTDDAGSFAVVELFTSEGCSSCPPADKLLGKLVDEAQQTDKRIFALAFHVDYWDYLGWKDAYSSAAYSDRQRGYANAFRSNRIYTPQMIVNGQHEFVGSSQYKAKKYVEDALNQSAQINLSLETRLSENGQVSVSYAADAIPSNSIINFALVERNIVREIKRGENHGRTLHHDNVVRSFQKMDLKDKQGKATLQMPDNGVMKNSAVIVYVQNRKTMQVLGAEGMDLKVRVQ